MWIKDTTVKCPQCEATVDKSEMVYSEQVDDRICSCCFEDEKVVPTAIETTSNLNPIFQFILKPYFTPRKAV